MRKILIFFILSTTLYGLEVDREVIQLNMDITVEFENYVGPHLFYNTEDEIRAIGSYLATVINPGVKGEGDYNNKYIMYHRPKAEWEKDLKSADVLYITDQSLIDNVNNIELIISQYLIDNYGYSKDDGDLIAHLLVIYNAVYRGDGEHFSNIYSSETVISQGIENLGIDLQYFNWPGKTYLYIPLSNNIYPGKLTNIDSDILTTDKVIEVLKTRDEDSIEVREDIINFKEREYEEIASEVSIKEDNLKDLKAAEDNGELDESIDLSQIQIEIDEKQKTLTEKEDAIVELRDDLAKDKNELLNNETKSENEGKYKFILNRRVSGELFGQIVTISDSGNIYKKSSVNSIRSGSFIILKDSVYIIAGGDKSNQIVSLGKLNSKTLEVEVWANVPCYSESVIINKNNKIFAVIEIDGRYYIGQFSSDLEYLSRSPVDIYEDSYILLKDDKFYIQAGNNSIKLVNLSDFITE